MSHTHVDASIVYTLGNNLYVNMTNRCPCSCDFCIRKTGDGVGSAENLWLDAEPSAQDILDELGKPELSDYGELVFCGYGEPFCALDTMLEVAGVIKATSDISIRINTNGLGDLIASKSTPPLLSGLVDTVSISMNAPTSEKYNDICHPSFGEKSFDAILDFALQCREYVPRVVMTVVDVIPKEEIEACSRLAEKLGVDFRIRTYS